MTDREKRKTASMSEDMLRRAMAMDCDLLILDELCAARKYGMITEALAKAAVLERAPDREVVITGREPEPWMMDAADYITEMCCRRHPFQRGVAARRGVEY